MHDTGPAFALRPSLPLDATDSILAYDLSCVNSPRRGSGCASIGTEPAGGALW